RPAAFDMADWLRQSKRAHHALEKSARGNGRPEPLTTNSTTPRYELRQLSVSATITWRSQRAVTGSVPSTGSAASGAGVNAS
ncbi:hypothetical protein, partial [Burkholderia ambifaria]|uniref:hypothetical protein n=1 Tax=Burkholderia ambifaria TaxID=152480 RepID=UPI001ABB1F42